MNRLGLIFLFFFIAFFSSAQEKVIVDSIPKNQKDIERLRMSIEKPLLFNEEVSVERIPFLEPFSFKQPLLPDYSGNLDFKKLLRSKLLTTGSYSISEYGFSSFLFNGNVFNQASYRISDHLILGGNSFGIQSILEQPRINPAIQNMSAKGVGMYMQYNISKNFKIETRVSISNHQCP